MFFWAKANEAHFAPALHLVALRWHRLAAAFYCANLQTFEVVRHLRARVSVAGVVIETAAASIHSVS